jgi:hypothetical protein
LKLKPTILAAAAALALAACGDDDSSSEEHATLTPTQAIGELDLVSRGLQQAYAAYDDGDFALAGELAGDAYLEHFELVEGPLEEIDEELNEELEEGIREELTAALESGAPKPEVKALRKEISFGIEDARAALEAAE